MNTPAFIQTIRPGNTFRIATDTGLTELLTAAEVTVDETTGHTVIQTTSASISNRTWEGFAGSMVLVSTR